MESAHKFALFFYSNRNGCSNSAVDWYIACHYAFDSPNGFFCQMVSTPEFHPIASSRFLLSGFSATVTEGVITTRSNRMKFRLWNWLFKKLTYNSARGTKATLSGLKNNGNLSLNICFDKIAVNLNSRRQNIEKKTFIISLLSTQAFLGVGRIPESGNFLFVESGIKEYFVQVESGILSFGVQNTEYSSRKLEFHKRLESRDQVPPTKTGIQYLESGIHGVESRIQFLGCTWRHQKSN